MTTIATVTVRGIPAGIAPYETGDQAELYLPEGIEAAFPGAGDDSEYVFVDGSWVYRLSVEESQGEVENDLAALRASISKGRRK